jgi:glucose-6-phosphate 1-epimerase
MSTALTADQLQARFGRPGRVRFEAGPGGLVRALVTAREAEAHLSLQGAHVTHYQPRGQAPVLFLSTRSAFAPGKAIRGGVPVVFPWFGARAGDPSAPAHGFARAAAWQMESVDEAADGTVAVTLSLTASEATRAVWPPAFVARYRVAAGATLDLRLEIENASAGPFAFEEALHTYLGVADVRTASISGLAGTTYIDKVDRMARKAEGTAPIRLTAETDRIYLGTRATCVVDDPKGGRRLVVEKAGSDATVVWNPWAEKARALSDLGGDQWPAFVCIETANAADHAVTLAPGARHAMRAVIRAEPR